MAVKQGARFLWGSESLKDKTVAVQGLGAVGFPLAEDFLADGARLVVCDRDPEAVRKLVAASPEGAVRVGEPEAILGVEADIFAPAAVGGILDEHNIPELKFE
jgi:leucine dehydrogenase